MSWYASKYRVGRRSSAHSLDSTTPLDRFGHSSVHARSKQFDLGATFRSLSFIHFPQLLSHHPPSTFAVSHAHQNDSLFFLCLLKSQKEIQSKSCTCLQCEVKTLSPFSTLVYLSLLLIDFNNENKCSSFDRLNRIN